MGDLARVWETTHNPGIRSCALHNIIEDAGEIFVRPFTVPILPGRVFVFVSTKVVAAVLHAVGIYARPTLIPREEWYGANTVPWDVSHCEIGSLLRIKKGTYHGCLGYVMGTSEHSDTVILAVVPRTARDLPTTRSKHKRPKLDVGSSSMSKTSTRRSEGHLFYPNKLAASDENRDVPVRHNYSEDILSGLMGIKTKSSIRLMPGFPNNVLYQFKKKFFFRGLQLFRLDRTHRTESTVALTTGELEPFVISGIDKKLDRILSQMHWKSGQLVIGRYDIIYRIITPHFGIKEVEVVTIEGDILSHTFKMNELRPYFTPGDEVIVLVGENKNKSGMVIKADYQSLTMLCAEEDQVSILSPRICLKVVETQKQITVSPLWVAVHFRSHVLATQYPIGSAVDVKYYGKLHHGTITGVFEGTIVYVKLEDGGKASQIVSIPSGDVEKVYKSLDNGQSVAGRAIRLNDYVSVTSSSLSRRFEGKAGYVANITAQNQYRLRGGSIGNVSNLTSSMRSLQF